jgi:ribosomal-protein-alanine N-acetyltransferase
MNEAGQGLAFQRFTLEYLPNVLFIESESYPEPWTHGMFRQELTNPNSYIYLALQGDSLIGYAGFWLVLDEAHITRITVAEKHRSMGYGRAITEHMLERAFDLGAALARLEVRETNVPARALYDRLGFVVEGKRIGYYQRTNENAVLMVKRF